MNAFFPWMVSRRSPIPTFSLFENAKVVRSISNMLGMPLLSMFSVCCCTLVMRYGSSVHRINLFNVDLSFVSEFFILTPSGALSTKPRTFALITSVLRMCLSWSYFYRILATIWGLSASSLESVELGKKRLQNMRSDTLQDKSEGAANGRSNVIAFGRCFQTIEVNVDTSLHQWNYGLHTHVSDCKIISDSSWCYATKFYRPATIISI